SPPTPASRGGGSEEPRRACREATTAPSSKRAVADPTLRRGAHGLRVRRALRRRYGERSPERVNRRNGYRERVWDTRAGTVALEIPKLRQGAYFPGWLLEPRRRAERALVQVVADCYLAGVSARRVDGLVKRLGIEGVSRSQ